MECHVHFAYIFILRFIIQSSTSTTTTTLAHRSSNSQHGGMIEIVSSGPRDTNDRPTDRPTELAPTQPHSLLYCSTPGVRGRWRRHRAGAVPSPLPETGANERTNKRTSASSPRTRIGEV
uniref:Putative secreted protein n=1 Tax=Anopheles triannulatus TaxID=58253 RepID=A0A2M4B5N7_9DIPT